MNYLLDCRFRSLWVAAAALVVLPFALRTLGLTINTASVVVILAIAASGLNILVGYTGLTSFGQSAWFGIAAYGAAIAQRRWFPGEIVLPVLFALITTFALSLIVGLLILRRRGVYFSLLTLALAALTYTVAFRWTDLTGGEDGLGGLARGSLGPVSIEGNVAYYILCACTALATLFVLLRITRSPFGQVLVAIRENQIRAQFQGYPVERYKLAAFAISAVITGLAGALMAFQNYLVSAEAVSVNLSGELLAMVVIGGMHHLLGPALGALFFILFRELLSIWSSNWLLWFGLVFIGFVIYSPEGLVGIWRKLLQRWRPPPEESAAMNRRKIYEGLPLPDFLLPKASKGPVLAVDGVSKRFGGIRAVEDASIVVNGGQIHALIGPNGAGKTTLFNLVSRLYRPDAGTISLHGREIRGMRTHEICHSGLARSFQITSVFRNLPIYENLRLSLQACHPGKFDLWRDANAYLAVHEETKALIRFLGLEGIEGIPAGSLSYGGQRLVDLGIALGSKPQVLLLDEPLAGLAAAERERVSRLVTSIASHIPVLIVEHDVDRILSFSHRVTVTNQGKVLMSGSPAEVRTDKRVQEIYTGTGVPSLASTRGPIVNPVQMLRFERVNAYYGKSHILNDATLDVRAGEIVALLGRNGAGKSTLLKTIAGLVRAASGRIEFKGLDVTSLAAPDIARMGIGYVPQGRGLFAGMTVAENLALGRLARSTNSASGVVWSDECVLSFFPQLRERMHVAADYLSGGEQQMLAVARALSANVDLLLLDEPFEGLSPAVTQELFRTFDRLRGQISMVIVEHNLDLVLALADRVFALERGSVFHEAPATRLLNDIEHRKEVLWL
ncbi:MAG: branched-chain amino acid ABC transporter ATP-binding protein/permease [Beijerinckiaceae bacterium]